MCTKQFIFFLMFIKVADPEKCHLINILESQNNFFYKINTKIHILMNNLFDVLKLDLGFINSSTVQELLTMHIDLNKISEKRYIGHKKLQSKSDLKLSNKDIVADVMLGILHNEIGAFYYNNSHTGISIEDLNTNVLLKTEMEDLNHVNLTNVSIDNMVQKDSIDSLEYLRSFMSKIEKLTVENLTKPMTNENNIKSKDCDLDSDIDSESPEWRPVSYEDMLANSTRRLYSGREITIGEYRFVVSLHIMSAFTCGGSIISTNMVLTAASCLQPVYNSKQNRDNPRNIFVRIGSDYTMRSGQLIPVTHVYYHPEYDSVTLKNNLAIVKLMTELDFKSSRNISAIEYDKTIGPLQKKVKFVTALGWGAKDARHKVNNLQKLSKAPLATYELRDCMDVYSTRYVTKQNFCAGYKIKGGGACNGDVGGPAVVSGLLVGVMSFGSPVCGAKDSPTVFMKIGYYANWIDKVIDNAKPNRWNKTSKTISHRLDRTGSLPAGEKIPNEKVNIVQKMLQDIVDNNTVVDYLLYKHFTDKDPIIFTSPNKRQYLKNHSGNKGFMHHDSNKEGTRNKDKTIHSWA